MRETKITEDHLKRDAYLYVRQSSPRQVTEHNESTQRQYALRNRAIAAGWPVERIRVIDCDLANPHRLPRRPRDGGGCLGMRGAERCWAGAAALGWTEVGFRGLSRFDLVVRGG